MQDNHNKPELDGLLITYERGDCITPQHDLRYSLMASIVPTISDLLILGRMSGFLYLPSNFFFPASSCTVSSHSPVTSQAKVHLHP